MIAFIFFVVAMSARAGLPPTTLKGDAQSTKTTTFNFEVSNSLATKTGTGTKIEVGNSNILVNPSWEHQTATTGWTLTAGSFTSDTTPVEGSRNALITLTAQSLQYVQDSTTYASQFADGVQGLAMVRVKTSITSTPLYVCPRNAGVTAAIAQCAPISADGKWRLYKVPFILGGTSNGISITSNAVSITGDIRIDDAYVGATTIAADVDQSRIAGESYFAGTTSCTWTRNNTAIGAFATVAACPGPTVVYSSMGQWQTTDSDLPRQTINNLPAGVYKAKFQVESTSNTGTGYGVFAIFDGTNTCYAVSSNSSNSAQAPANFECTFVYTTPGNRSFEVYAASTGAATNIANSRTAPASGSKFILEYFGSGSIYSASCGSNCVDTFSAKGTSAGVISDDTQDFINGNCSLATSTYTCTFRSGVFTATPTCTVTTVYTSGVIAIPEISAQSASSLQFVTQTVNDVNKAEAFNIICHKAGADLVATRTIVGSFNEVVTTPGVTKPVIADFRVGATGTVTDDVSDIINGNCTNATPMVCTFNTGKFASGTTPICQTGVDSSTADATCKSTESTTTTSIRCNDGATNNTTTVLKKLSCRGIAP
jgi:hypothetical protein